MHPPAPTVILFSTDLNGGIGRNLLNLAGAFDAMGIRCRVLLEREEGPYLEQIGQYAGIDTLPTTHALLGVPALARYLRRHRPDAMLTPNVRLTVLSLRARRLSGHACRIAVNVHNTYSRTFSRLPVHKRERRIRRIATHYARTDAVIAVSRGVADDLAELTGLARSAIQVIYNPVVTPSLASMARAAATDVWLDDDGPPVILAVGRLEPQKGLMNLIEAFEQLCRQRPCRLLILGEGSERDALTRRIQASPVRAGIRLPGNTDNPYACMARASLLVLSSTWEGFGNVLVEAMACGTPVVATDCPHGPREILEEGRLGSLVPMNDPAALATAMGHALDTPIAPGVLQAAAQAYRSDRIARAYLEQLLPHEYRGTTPSTGKEPE